jgi:hypothetical protein
MIDWEITEEELKPAAEEEDRPSSPRSRVGFYVIMGAIVIIGVAIAAIFSWRFQEREVSLESDLLGQIRAEESARLFGNRDRIPTLILENAPIEWRNRFTQHIIPPQGEVQPVDITIESVEYNGSRAEVWVRLGAQVQRRAYEQTPEGWRRVPLIFDSQRFGDIAVLAEGGAEIRHHRSDEQFVIQLAADLPRLQQTIEAWHGDSVAWETRAPLIPSFINVQPEEFRPSITELPANNSVSLFINSPQVVSLSPAWNLSGESAVRVQLARTIWARVPNQRFGTVEVPGAMRWVNATQTVLAMRWALPPEIYATLTEQWRAQAETIAWQSPFFALNFGGGDIDPFAPHADALALLLVADGVIELIGTDADAVAQIRPTLENASGWDDFFSTLVGKNTLELEATVRGTAAPSALAMPFTATLAPSVGDGTRSQGFAVNVAGHESPIVVDSLLGGADIRLPSGETLNPQCASLFGELELEGIWLEEGLRLNTTQISIPTLTLPVTFTSLTPPPNTIAYVAAYSDTTGGGIAGMRHISAVTEDGTLTPVLTPSHSNVVPMGGVDWGIGNSTTGIMFTIQGDQGCNAQWYLRYVPGVGITGAWLAPQLNGNLNPGTYMSPHWDDVSGRGMLVEVNSSNPAVAPTEMPFWWLEDGTTEALGDPDGYLPAGVSYQLAPGATSVLIYQLSHPETGRGGMVSVDIDTMTERTVYEPPISDYYSASYIYSPDGAFLYLAWQVPSTSGGDPQGTVLQRVDLASGAVEEWWSQEQGTIFFVAPDTRIPYLYAMTLSMEEPVGVRLVQITEEGSTVFENGGEAFGISLMLRCGTGGLLYLRLDTPTDQETRYELDPRYLHRVRIDEAGVEQSQVFPLSTYHIPLLCP